jgi:FMN phosphatase YigB (HAD superfamily)
MSDDRPLVNSFDVFNTLIARRCIEPRAIRYGIAATLDYPDFPAHRHAAEVAVEHRDYTIDDIYTELARAQALSPERTEALKRAEIEAELANVIPIAENLAQVRAGDLLVSDMYLGADMIQRLLDRAGLTAEAALVVTSSGKARGTVWPPLLQRFRIARHLGDDPRTDIASARAFGIEAVQTAVATPNDVETYLAQQGLHQLSAWLREARLTSRHADPALRQVQLLQTAINVPLLILSAFHLLRLGRQLGTDRLLFSARDCNLWIHAYRLLADRFGGEVPALYFQTNRLMRTQPSEAYLAYCRSVIGERSLIVDICGTGWSSSMLLDRLGLGGGALFFIHDFSRDPIRAQYDQMAKPKLARPIHSILGTVAPGLFNGSHLEMCNFADHPPARDMAPVAGAFVPVFEEDQRPAAMREAVSVQRSAFFHALSLAGSYDFSELERLDEAALPVIVGTLYAALSRQTPLPPHCLDFHQIEDRHIMTELAKTGARS